MSFQLAIELKGVGEEKQKQKAQWQLRAATHDGALYIEEPQASACPVCVPSR